MTRTSNNELINGCLYNGYDYANQAWVINGVYAPCGHPEAGTIIPARTDSWLENGQRKEIHIPARQAVDCNCYGRMHAGEACTTDGHGRAPETATNGHHRDCDDKSVAHGTFMCSELCQYTAAGSRA